MADTDPDRGDYLRSFAATTHCQTKARNINIKPRRFWFAPHDATRYAIGFGDKEIAILDDTAVPFMAQWIVATLNARIVEDECKNPNP